MLVRFLVALAVLAVMILQPVNSPAKELDYPPQRSWTKEPVIDSMHNYCFFRNPARCLQALRLLVWLESGQLGSERRPQDSCSVGAKGEDGVLLRGWGTHGTPNPRTEGMQDDAGGARNSRSCVSTLFLPLHCLGRVDSSVLHISRFCGRQHGAPGTAGCIVGST